MAGDGSRYVQVAHALPCRVRLRLPWLGQAPDEAAAIGARIAALDGVVEVQVRAFTGSVLCLFDEHRVGAEALVAAAAQAIAVERVVAAGEEPPAAPPLAQPGDGHRSSVARALTRSVREINADVLNATEGRLDLGTMAFLGFISVGAAEIVFSRQLPAPPWFNLAWWAVQTFTAYESGGESDGVAGE